MSSLLLAACIILLLLTETVIHVSHLAVRSHHALLECRHRPFPTAWVQIVEAPASSTGVSTCLCSNDAGLRGEVCLRRVWRVVPALLHLGHARAVGAV